MSISLHSELNNRIGRVVVVWVNHPNRDQFRGTLTEVRDGHITITDDTRTYYIPFSAITAVQPE
jgi:ribosome maturation factor RimP